MSRRSVAEWLSGIVYWGERLAGADAVTQPATFRNIEGTMSRWNGRMTAR
jgi:hypothetical protein